MASTAPSIKPPKLNPDQGTTGSVNSVSSQSLAPPPSQIASPPTAKQSPTGGSNLAKTAAKNLATGAGGTTGSQNTIGSQSLAPAPSGSPDPGMPNTTPVNSAQDIATAGLAPPSAPPATTTPATPSATAPLIPTDEANITNAQSSYGITDAGLRQQMYNAAMAYGDPTTEAQWGMPVTNPNSALALAALKAQNQTLADQNSRGSNGTLFSSLALQDQGNIASAQQRADLAGYQKYQTANDKFNLSLAQAEQALQGTTNSARADERQQAIAGLPQPDTTAASPLKTTPTTTAKAPKPVKPPKAKSTGAKAKK